MVTVCGPKAWSSISEQRDQFLLIGSDRANTGFELRPHGDWRMARRPNVASRPKLSTQSAAIVWLRQFQAKDQLAASKLLDALVLLNEDDVGSAIRSQLRKLALARRGTRRKTAVYAEREHPRREFFVSAHSRVRDGAIRLRAFGNVGPAAVSPARGSTRVGSEGWMAFVVSQAVQASPDIYLNNPGPDRIHDTRLVSSLL